MLAQTRTHHTTPVSPQRVREEWDNRPVRGYPGAGATWRREPRDQLSVGVPSTAAQLRQAPQLGRRTQTRQIRKGKLNSALTHLSVQCRILNLPT